MKDLKMYFFYLQNQSNDYLKDLLKLSSELDFYLSENLQTVDSRSIYEIVKFKTLFYERLKYLTFYDWVISLFKMQALLSMSNYLEDISKILGTKKHLKLIQQMKIDFFTNRQYFTKTENVLKISINNTKINNHVSKNKITRFKSETMLYVS
jgi:hypothetical protein